MACIWARLSELGAEFLHSVGVFPNRDDGPQVLRLTCTVLGIALGTSSFAWLLLKKQQQGGQSLLPPRYAAVPDAETRGVQETETMAAPNTDNAAVGEATPTVVEPHWLMCPLTNALFRDPVFVVDSGNTYERDVVLGFWRIAGVAKDPLTNLQLATNDVRTNWAVRREVQSFLDEHPNYVPAGWDSRELPTPDVPNAVPEPAAANVEVDDEDGLPAAVRAHCAAVAAAHGGHIPEPLLAHFAAVFHVDRQVLQQAFGQRVQPPAGEADAAELPAAARVHCDHLARENGGSLPDALLTHLSTVFNLDVATLRAAYPGAPAPPED